MKKAATIILTLMITVVSFGQTQFENFKVIKNDFIWQKVYYTEMNHHELGTYFKGLSFTSQIENNNGIFVGISPKTAMKKFNGKNPTATQPYTGFITIELKEKRYRVTVKDIKFDVRKLAFYGGGVSVGSGDNETWLLGNIVKNGKIKDGKRDKRFLSNLNHDFNGIFTITEKINDEW